MSGLVAPARSLSPSEALGRATGQPVSRSSVAAPVMTVGTADAPALYVFNRSEGGWIIVSADDVAAPVIGYSDSGSFDPENLPENLRGWLDLCSSEIRQASDAGVAPYMAPAVSRADEKAPIEPLVKTKWNQNSPYNKYCPNGNTYTGCVATAMAQVMKYYNWPEKAGDNANFSYSWGGQTYTADFRNYQFDWTNMLDTYVGGQYSTAQADAVAKLMQACGYSVCMQYGTTASAAYCEQVASALVSYFNYDNGLSNEFRNLHSSAEWENMIYDNLKNVGPMVYWGGAHCFVCDGYRSDGYFHFNWGWSGGSDGYFLLTALAPGAGGIGAGTGDYTTNQGALLGVKPSTGTDSPRKYTFRIEELTDAYQGSIGFNLTGKFVNNSPYQVPEGKFVFQIYSEDGSKKITTCQVFNPGSCSIWGVNITTGNTVYITSMQASLSNVPDGNYRLYPAVLIDGVEYSFQCPPTIAGYVNITCQGGKAVEAVIPSTGELVVEDLNTYGDYFVSSYVKFSGVAKFTGEGDTNASINAVLLRADGTVRAYSSAPITMDFSSDGTPFEYIIPWFYDKAMTVEAGDYRFGIAKSENGLWKILGTCPVKVNARVPQPTFKTPVGLAVENATAVDPENIVITASIEGTAGVVYRDVIFTIFKGLNSVKQEYVPMYVSAGQTAEVVFKTSLPGAVPGDRYTVYVSRDNSGKMEYISGAVSFTIGDTSGLADIEADSDAPAEYFNLQGLRVDSVNLTPGIYIRRQGDKVTKVLVK